MSNVPGIVPNILNNLVSTGASPARAVAIVGQRDTSDTNYTAIGGQRAYDGTDKGIIYNYSSLGDWLALLGQIDIPDDATDGWVAGEQDDSSSIAAITPHSISNSLLYALALAYLANPSLNVYAAILDSSIAANDTTTAPLGTTHALTDLLLYDDIGYLVIAGIDPVAAGKVHAETATNSRNPAYNMPRCYVTGLDLFKVFDGVTYSGAGAPLDATNDLANVSAAWTSAKSDYGLTINFIGNNDYNFGVIGDTTNGVGNTRQIGGQLSAAYVAGFLATQKESAGITFSTNSLGSNRFTAAYGDSTSIPYPFSLTEINEAITDGWFITRFTQNSHVFAKGINYVGAAGTSWTLYPHRSITNFVHKSVADALQQFLGRQQTQANMSAAQKLVEGILGNAVSRSYIDSVNSVRVRSHPTEVDAIIAEVEFNTVKPINKIYLNITVN